MTLSIKRQKQINMYLIFLGMIQYVISKSFVKLDLIYVFFIYFIFYYFRVMTSVYFFEKIGVTFSD